MNRFIALLVLVFGLSFVLSQFNLPFDLLVHLVAGFWFFLSENLTALSSDAGTWVPGLGAFLLATVFSHRFLAAWAARTSRHWSFATTFCVALIVPVLFVIAFLIPGVLVQWEILRQVD